MKTRSWGWTCGLHCRVWLRFLSILLMLLPPTVRVHVLAFSDLPDNDTCPLRLGWLSPGLWCSWRACSSHFWSGTLVMWVSLQGPGCPGFCWWRLHSQPSGNCDSGSGVWVNVHWRSWKRPMEGRVCWVFTGGPGGVIFHRGSEKLWLLSLVQHP